MVNNGYQWFLGFHSHEVVLYVVTWYCIVCLNHQRCFEVRNITLSHQLVMFVLILLVGLIEMPVVLTKLMHGFSMLNGFV